jgi:hypothetical protein
VKESSPSERESDEIDLALQPEELEWGHLMSIWGTSHAAYIQQDRSLLEEGRRYAIVLIQPPLMGELLLLLWDSVTNTVSMANSACPQP